MISQPQVLLITGFADFRLIESHALIYLGRRIFADYQILVELLSPRATFFCAKYA